MSDRAVPILPSRNLDETLRFYQALDFENRGAPPQVWGYLILGRGDAELHFYEDRGVDPLSTAAMYYLYVEDAQQLFEEWSTRIVADPLTGSRISQPTATDYGMCEFAVVDRSGNLLRIGSALPRTWLRLQEKP